MNLRQFREFFAKQSGRYDLIDPTEFSNNGIDLYINAAQGHLDRRVEIREMLGEATYTLNADTVSLLVDFSAVHDVYLVDSSENKQTRLQRLDLHEARILYQNSATFEDIDSDTPIYYVIGNTRTPTSVPVQDVRRKILLLPPPNTQETILVEGTILHKKLVEDGDENFWTISHPFILSLAVQLMLEKAQRNTQGIRDMTEALEEELKYLDMETVEENAHQRDHRANSWRYVNEQPIPYRSTQNSGS
jgi:hypothetical protein